MVAIVTGNGLGLQSSSALGLGGRGQVGNAGFGKSGEQVFVNAATGNLILRDRDQWLLGRGVDAELYRAYNSQAQLLGAAWRSGTSKQVDGLTGALNAVGSTVQRTDWDGSRVIYAWDAARSLYVATSGSGTRDTLTMDQAGHWRWSQGDGTLTEYYNPSEAGSIVRSVDRDGNETLYIYGLESAGGPSKLTEIRTANGESTYLDYDGAQRLTKVRTVTQAGSGTQTSTAVRYSYDSLGRLSTVTLDLSPDDNSVADGKVFTTTYGYDGNSARVASIAQSDGSQIAFTYQQVGGDYRVATIAQTSDTGVLRTTSLSYDLANRRTVITDPLGLDTILSYDEQGRLLQTSSPAVNGTRQTQSFTYNAAGQVATVRDGLNNEVKYTYDAAGNLTKQEDAVGTVVERTYGANNQLLSETVSGPTTAATTTHYVYDAEQHLRFKVSAEGRVTEFRYNAAGQQEAMLTYSVGTYTGADKSEAAVAGWVGAQARIGERTDTAYDFRGNVSSVTKYGTLRADGSGLIDDKTIQSRFVYDAQGRLLQRYVGAIANPEVEQYTYDGLGRVTATTAFNDSITLTQYDDAQRRTIVTFNNGLVRTSTYNHAGELIAVAESGNATMLSQVKYAYDANGRLRMTEDALGARTHVLYDEAGRRAAEIDELGTVTEYQYNANNQVSKVTRYFKQGNNQWLLDENGKPRNTMVVGGQTVALTYENSGAKPAANLELDRNEWRFYDNAGRLDKTVRNDGYNVYVTDHHYDASSRLIDSVSYSSGADWQFLQDPTRARAQPLPSHLDRTTRYFYDQDGLLVGTLDAQGALTEMRYDASGRKIEVVGYALETAEDLRASGTLEQLRPTISADDIHRYSRYDSRGLLALDVDGEGYVTRYEYDAAGNVSRRIRGERIAPGSMAAPQTVNGSFRARSAIATGGVYPSVDVWVDGVKIGSFVIGSNTETTYSFSAAVLPGVDHQVALVYNSSTGSEIWVGAAEFGGVAFDAGGIAVWGSGGNEQVAGVTQVRAAGTQHLNESGALRWMVSATQTLAAATTLPGLLERTDYEYDVEGRLLRKTEYSTSGDSVTQYVYDRQGHLVSERRGVRQSSYRYDLQGRVIAQLSGEGVKALEALGSTPTQAQVDALWTSHGVKYQYDARGQRIKATDAHGRSTFYYYDQAGQLIHTINALGEVVAKTYNGFGEVEMTTTYALRLSSVLLNGLTGGQVTEELRVGLISLQNENDSRISVGYTGLGNIKAVYDAMGAQSLSYYSAFGEAFQTERWSTLDSLPEDLVVANFGYDRMGRQVSLRKDAYNAGPYTWKNYDAFGRQVDNIQQDGRTDILRYDRNGRIVQKYTMITGQESLDGVVKTTYDAFGNVLTNTDRSGNRTSYSYTAFNREIRATTAEGIETIARYNEHGEVVELIDGRGQRTVYEYDLDGRLIRATTPAGTIESDFDNAGQLIETTDARGVKTVYAYDAAGRVLTRTLDPDGLAIKIRYEYDAKGQQVRTTDALGMVTETRYDLNGRTVAVVVDAGEGRLNLTTTYEYDALGQVLKVVEGAQTPAQKVTLHQYDKQGNRIATTIDPDGLALKTQFTYDKAGQVVARTDANGYVTRFVYDGGGRMTHSVDASGGVERRSYDKDSRLVGVTRYAGRIDLTGLGAKVTAAQIDARVQPQPGLDHVQRYAFDRDGRLRYSIDSLGHVTEAVYDNAGNVVRTVGYATPIAASVQATVAAVEAALTAQGVQGHANDRVTQTIYDAAGRAVFQLDAGRYVTRNEYDANGNLVARSRFVAPYPAGDAVAIATLQAWAGGQAHNASAKDHWIYDAAGRLTWQVDAGERVVRHTYDAAGNRVQSVAFMQQAFYPTQSPASYDTAGMNAWYAQYVQIDARYANPTTMWFYDAAGRSIFSYDAEGYFTENAYDATGNVTSSARYHRKWGYAGTDREITLNDTPTSLRALLDGLESLKTQYRYDAAGRLSDTIDAAGGVRHYQRDGLGQVVAEFAAWGTADQVATRRNYDAMGRLVEETRAADTAIAARTRYAYDAFGQTTSVTDPRGVELAESDSSWALAQRKALGYINETGAALRAADLSAAQKLALLARYTSRSVYDANGRLLQSIDALGATVTRAYNAFGNAVQVTDALGKVGRFYFDALGRVTDQVDPEGYLTRTEYDFLGNAKTVYRFASRVSPSDPDIPSSWPTGNIAITQMTYNLLGQLVKAVDAEQGVETYVYDAFGNISEFYNKLGGRFWYQYDKLGRKVHEWTPVYSIHRFSGQLHPVRNYFQYDAHGNLIRTDESGEGTEARVTLFGYDALNRKISSSGLVATGQGDVNAVETLKYDPRGNLIERIGPNNARIAYYYDANDRLSGQVDANGLLTLHDYDAIGNLIRSRAFLQPVTLPVGAALPAAPTGESRETQHRYDANGRRIESRVIGALFGRKNADGTSYQLVAEDIVETWSYDLGGRMVRHIDGNGGASESYYNALGQKLLEIDAEGYGTAWVRDAEGNAVRETKFSRRHPPSEPPTSDVASYIAGWPTDGSDRITTYVYDLMGRRLSESRLNVAYGTVDASTGQLTEAFGTATTSYSYDAAGNLLRRTDANGSVFGWEYDKTGRNTAAVLPSMVDYAGRTVAARTEYTYNGLNQVVKEVRRGIISAQDQVTTYLYGTGGRLLSKTNALNQVMQFGYDAAGDMVRMSYVRTDSQGVKRTETIQVGYDESHRETHRVTVGSDGTRSVERRTQYNLFGDVTGRGTGVSGWQEYAEYDRTGRMFKTNMQGGITKVFVYDANGNAALQIESQALNLRDWTLEQIMDAPLEDQEKIFHTLTLYDGRNQVVDVIQAAMTTAGERLGLKPTTVNSTRPGQIQTSVGGHLGGDARTPELTNGDGLISIAPFSGSPGRVTSVYNNRGWGQINGGGTSDNWPPDLMKYDVWVPDLSAAFGSQYEVRIVVEGTQTAYSIESGTMRTEPLSGQGVLSNGPGSVTVNVPVDLLNLRNGNYRTVDVAFALKIFVTPRGSGGGREFELGSQSLSATLEWDRDWDWDTEVRIRAGSGSLNAGFDLAAPVEFSPDTLQMPIDAFREDVSPQVYVRPKGSTGAYQALTVQRDAALGKAIVDISSLADGQYEVLYVAERNDGALMRRDKYELQVGPSQYINRIADTTDATFQVNGVGNFVWTANGLDMSALRTRRSEIPSSAVVEYRRKGSQDPWAGTNALGGLPPMSTPGSFRWDTSGLSGDYEVVLKLRGADGKVFETIAGEIGVGETPRVSLDFAHDANVVRFSNLPPNAATMGFSLQRADGSVAATVPSTAIVNGELVWSIPPELMAEVGTGVRTYKLVATLTDNLVVPPTTYYARGEIQIGPQRDPVATIKLDQHLFTLNLDPQQPEGQVVVLHYRPEGNDATAFAQVVILRGADGKFRWDSLGLDKKVTYEYFYDVFRTLEDAQNPAGGQSLTRNSGYFWADIDRPASEVRWELTNFEPSSLTIHRRQAYNAYGEIASETDGNGNTTTLSYNTLGKMTRKTDPKVWVTRANGFREETNPITEYVYDRVGSIVAYRDANGNLTTQAWNYGTAQPTLKGEWHADGGFKFFGVDVFGNKRVAIDELGRQTDFTYDAGGRLIRLDRPVGEDGMRVWESYGYDELDHRIRHTNSLGTDTTDFNIEGEVSRVASAQNRVTLYTATWDAAANDGNGAWRRVMTDANGRSTTDLIDATGRKLSHVDLGGHSFAYEYNYAGLLKQSGKTAYEYYSNGLLKRMTDTGSGIKGYYEYDNNGNRTFEGFTGKDGAWVFQQSKGTYDALNRLVRVYDPRYEIDYGFDAQGNRIHMKSVYKDGINGATQTQEYWYQYDNMNRFTITMGKLQGVATSASDTGAYVTVGNEDGVLIGYDLASQRRLATYGRDGHTERYDYDARGYLTDTTIDGVLRARRINDAAGRVSEYLEYQANGTTSKHTIHTWDNDSLLMEDRDNLTNKGTKTFRLADGTVDYTQTYGDETTLKTSFTYDWFDGAKQTEVKVQASNETAPKWAPGFSRYVYDDQGRIKLAYDQAGNRGFVYQVDGEGRILQRDELIGGQVDANGNVSNAQQNRHHSYYLFDDRQIGNVGNDGIDRIDYAKELAQHEAQAGAKNDDRHKRFTPVAGANFDENYQPINSLYPTAAPGSYIVKTGDTLQGIASALWGDGAMWYLLADANGLAPNQPLIANTVLTVPNKVTNIHNNASTFKPYDAGSAMGNTSPTVPEPPPPPAAKGCGGFVKILAIIVAVVVTIYTAGAASGAAWGFTSAMTAGMSAGAGYMALGAAVGSIVSQGVLIAGGVQDKFSWKQVGLAAIGGAITAGIGNLDVVAKMGAGLGRALGSQGLGKAIVTGAASNVANQGVNMLVGEQDGFDWKSVAISAVGAGVGYGVSQGIGRMQYGGQDGWAAAVKSGASRADWGRGAVRGFASGAAAGVVSAAARGNLSSNVLAQVGLDALGSTIGNAIVDAAQSAALSPEARWQAQDDALRAKMIREEEESRNIVNAGTAGDSRYTAGRELLSQRSYGRDRQDRLATSTRYGERLIDSYAIDRNSGNYIQVDVDTYWTPDPEPIQIEFLPEEAVQAAAPPLSMAARNQLEHEARVEANARYYDGFRGNLIGDMFANGMTIASDVGLGGINGVNQLWALAVDRQSGDEFKANAWYALTNPGKVYDQVVMDASDLMGKPLDVQMRALGGASLSTLVSAGTGGGLVRGVGYADEVGGAVKHVPADGLPSVVRASTPEPSVVRNAGEATDAARLLSRTGHLSGVARFDALFSESPQAPRMLAGLERRGVTVIDDVMRLKPGESASVFMDNGKLTLVYDGQSSSFLDMLHEARHVAQVQRVEKAGVLGQKDLFGSDRLLGAAERGAYEYEMRLGNRFGFSDQYMGYLRGQIDSYYPKSYSRKFNASPTMRAIFDALEPGLKP